MTSQSVSIEKSYKEVILENINSVEAADEDVQPSPPATPPNPQNTEKDKQEKNPKAELSWKPREERISRREFQPRRNEKWNEIVLEWEQVRLETQSHKDITQQLYQLCAGSSGSTLVTQWKQKPGNG